MARKKKATPMMDTVTMGGFARIKIMEDGRCVGDSGWRGPNRITQYGIQNFIADVLAADAGSSLVGYAQLGNGSAPATNSSRLDGSIGDSGSDSYNAVSKSTLTASNACTARFYGTFGSSDSFVTKTYNIANIGLYAATTSDSSLCCGQTYSSSQVNTNQDVQYTYELRFQTTA